MKEAFEIAKLIRKSLKADLSESEERRLTAWREASARNERDFQNMISDDFYLSRMEKQEVYDYRVAYGRFLQRKQQQRRFRRQWLNVARVAAVVLPLVLASVLYFTLGQEADRELTRYASNTDILPGSSKARLTLASGETLELGEQLADSTIVTDGARINASRSALEYASMVASESIAYNKLDIPRGGEFFLTLSDGTRVWLNSATSIRYPVAFGNKERRVYVEGEAYFEVTKNAGKPFVVEFMQTSVTVLGTSFNVHAYPDEKQTLTTLAEGSVRVQSAGKELVLRPGEQASVNTLSGEIGKRNVNVNDFSSWKDGRFVFVQQSLETIMQTLERWYDIEVVFKDERAKGVSLSGDLKRYDNFSRVMNMLQMTGDVRFELDGKTVYITTE